MCLYRLPNSRCVCCTFSRASEGKQCRGVATAKTILQRPILIESVASCDCSLLIACDVSKPKAPAFECTALCMCMFGEREPGIGSTGIDCDLQPVRIKRPCLLAVCTLSPGGCARCLAFLLHTGMARGHC